MLTHTTGRTITTDAINLSTVKEKFLESILREMSPNLTDKQYNTLRMVLVSKLNTVEILDPLRGYDERLKEENDVLLKQFINAKKMAGLSPKTLVYYKNTIKECLKYLDNKPVSLITAEDIRDYFGFKFENGSSTVTVNNVRRNLSSFFTWCFKEDFIIKSPMVKVEKIKERKVQKKEFSEHDIELMRECLNKKLFTASTPLLKELHLRNLAIFELLLASGIRVGELLGLSISDLDFTNKTGVVLGKGNKERKIFFNEKAKFCIENYLNQREANHGKLQSDAPLFVGQQERHKYLGISGVETVIRKLGEECGIEKVHPHRFRRTFATSMVRKGASLEKVQKLMGHENADTTMIYVNINDERLEQDYRKFS